MNPNHAIILFFLFFGNIALLQAQTVDTYRIVEDSVVQTEKHQPFLKKKEFWGVAIPAVMITYGILSVESDGLKQLDYSTKNELIEDKSLFYNTADNLLQFSPAALAFGLKLGGTEGRHNLSDMFILYTLSNVLEAGIVFSTKELTGRKRPDGSSNHSFPSGHTSTAFVAAEFLHQEYGDKSVWFSVGGYGMATLIGASRVYNNKHWVSDVVAGASIGILTTKAVYWLYPSLKKSFSKKDKNQQTFICPSYSNGNLSINLSYVF